MTRDNSYMRDSYAYRYLRDRTRSKGLPINAGEVYEHPRSLRQYPGGQGARPGLRRGHGRVYRCQGIPGEPAGHRGVRDTE